ncbi:MAG TPA: hypothetical protein VFF13_00740, partial [archaeon]|nr:hypothetical protein [archaeon]
MANVDFSGVLGGKKTPKDTEKKQEKQDLSDRKDLSEEDTEPVPRQEKSLSNAELESKIRKLEEELRKFSEKPKEEREEQSENFEFKKITEQIKQKVKEGAGTGSGFNESAIAQALKEPTQKKEAALSKTGKKINPIERVQSGVFG